MRRNEISCHSLGPLAKLISKRVIFRRTCARVKLHMNNARNILSYLFGVIVRVRIVFRNTAVGDCMTFRLPE